MQPSTRSIKQLLFAAALAGAPVGVEAAPLNFNDQTLPSIFNSAVGFEFLTDSGNPSNAVLAFVGGSATSGTGTPSGVNTLVGGQTRHATTTELDLSGGGSIAFDFLFGDDTTTPFGFFEDAGGSEDFILAYSTNNGGNFTEFFRIDAENSTSLGQFGDFNVSIPGAAQTASTRLSFLQVDNSGSSFDHWALDNVSIDGVTSQGGEIPLPATLTLLLASLGGLTVVGWAGRRSS